MGEKFGDNIVHFKKKEVEAEKTPDEKEEMIGKLKAVISALEKEDPDMALRFGDFLNKLKEPDYQITQSDKDTFDTSTKLAEDFLRRRDREKADKIFGVNNLA